MCDICNAMDPEGGDCSCGEWFRTFVDWADHIQSPDDAEWACPHPDPVWTSRTRHS